MRLTKKVFINGRVIAKTGLHIGSKNIGLSIGNTDNTVLRHPVTQEPYIPGSSLRGKMRSLIERFEGLWGHEKMSEDVQHGPYVGGKNGADRENLICKVFGVPAEVASQSGAKPLPPSRLIVRDGHLSPEKDSPANVKLKNAKNTDMPFTEVKTEVVIDRITSAAMPRQLERVPAGAEFDLELVLNVWEGDSIQEMVDLLFRGLILLQDDYLGGHGSRGSGKVKVVVNTLAEKTIADYKIKIASHPLDYAIPPELQPEKPETAHASL
jgi:CRISPR-associated protein Csm3